MGSFKEKETDECHAWMKQSVKASQGYHSFQ